jgi:PIN domain nuclease of toxin-antitoxin system
VIVLDTHALVWWLMQSPRLSARARRAIRRAIRPGAIVVSAASIFEVATVVRRGRLQLGTTVDQWLDAAKSLPELRIEPVTEPIARRAGSLAESFHGDPVDRIIVATAMQLQAKLLTADDRLRKSRLVETVW